MKEIITKGIKDKIFKMVESYIKEEEETNPIMQVSKDYTAQKSVPDRSFSIGDSEIQFGRKQIRISNHSDVIVMKGEDAIKMANLIIRVLGKI